MATDPHRLHVRQAMDTSPFGSGTRRSYRTPGRITPEAGCGREFSGAAGIAGSTGILPARTTGVFAPSQAGSLRSREVALPASLAFSPPDRRRGRGPALPSAPRTRTPARAAARGAAVAGRAMSSGVVAREAAQPMARAVSGRTSSGSAQASRIRSATMPLIWWTESPRWVASTVRLAAASPRSC